MGHLEYCSNCGSLNRVQFTEGRERAVCTSCGTIHYENPRPAATVIGQRDGKLLLVKRAAPPAVGEWCLPGGFIEKGEMPQEAALRELKEETGLTASGLSFFQFCPFPSGLHGEVMVMAYVADSLTGTPEAGDDASEVQFFPLTELPPIAFACHVAFIDSYLKQAG